MSRWAVHAYCFPKWMERIVPFTVVFAMVLGTLFGTLPKSPVGANIVEAASPEWKAGLAAACVTPEVPIRMAGYASRTKLSANVLDDLFAKVLVIEDTQGRRALLVTVDLLGFGGPTAEFVCRRIGEKTGLRREQILLSPSHTHAGPVFGLEKAGIHELPDEQFEVVRKYTERVVEQIVELSDAAIADLQPATLSWSTGEASFVMNRRQSTESNVRLGVNSEGYVDRSVPVLRIDSVEGNDSKKGAGSKKGSLRAVVFGCACHNTTCTGGNLQICGDYAGFAQNAIQKEHPNVQAMFVIGCAGDANPYPRTTPELALEHGTSLATEVCRVLKTDFAPVRGPLTVKLDWVELPLAPIPPREKLKTMSTSGPSWVKYNAKRMLVAVDANEPLLSTYRAPFALWQFGDDLTFVGLPGETVGGYVPLLQDALGPEKLWVAGYTNDWFGYLPTAKVLEEGGYETRGLFFEPGFFVPEVQGVVVETIRKMAQPSK